MPAGLKKNPFDVCQKMSKSKIRNMSLTFKLLSKGIIFPGPPKFRYFLKQLIFLRYVCHQKFELVLLRHGESEWNEKNIYTGWYDSPLTPKGVTEAKTSGESLKDGKYRFDIAYTSVLTRAKDTLNIVLEKIGQLELPTVYSWRLNERHYGGLTGLNKAETTVLFGLDQVKLWRRSYDVCPPLMDENHPYYKHIVDDPRYADGPHLDEFPMGESLKMTLDRVLPLWKNEIIPQIRLCKKLIIVAHGNSLRAIVKNVEEISDLDIIDCSIPTGVPFMYLLDDRMKPIEGQVRKYLGDPEMVKAALEKAAKMAKVKKKYE